MSTNVTRGMSVQQTTSHFDGFKVGIVALDQLERLVPPRSDTTQGVNEIAEALEQGDRNGQLRRPVGVIAGQKPDRYELIFGFRRVRAFRQLGYQDCKAVIFDVKAIGRGDYIPEDFQALTVVERYLLCDAVIRRYYADRVGLNEGGQLAVKQLGIGSRSQYGYGMKAIRSLDRRLLDWFDNGKLNTSAAWAISQLPPDEQAQIALGERPVPTSTELRTERRQHPQRSKAATKVSKAAAKITGKTQSCVALISQIDEAAAVLRALRVALQKTGGDVGTHLLDLPELDKKLVLAGKLISQVRVFVKGQ